MGRGEVAEKKSRKTRSDKKRDVKPTISNNLKDCIYRLSYITDKPVKDLAEILCEKGLQSRIVLDYLSQYFRRNLQFSNTIYIGDMARESLQKRVQSGKNERITVRFSQTTYENIYSLSRALDVTPSKATAILLDASIRNTNLLNAIVKMYLHEHIDKTRMNELKQVLNYIKKNNPYNHNHEMSWFELVTIMFEDIKDSATSIKDVVHNWLDEKE